MEMGEGIMNSTTENIFLFCLRAVEVVIKPVLEVIWTIKKRSTFPIQNFL